MRGEEGDMEKGASCLFLSQFVDELEFTETEQPEGEEWNTEVEAPHPPHPLSTPSPHPPTTNLCHVHHQPASTTKHHSITSSLGG